MKPILLDGQSLTREQVVAVAYGATVDLDAAQLHKVQRAADFLVEQVNRQEPIYGVSTGFGSNADKLLGAHRLRAGLPGAKPEDENLLEELQRNLIVTHAVCVGEPFATDVVRARSSALLAEFGRILHPPAWCPLRRSGGARRGAHGYRGCDPDWRGGRHTRDALRPCNGSNQ